MKHVLIGAMAVAALASLNPVSAQSVAPQAETTDAAAPAQHQGSAVRAHHRRHAVQAARNPSGGPSAEQLNRDELSHFQSMNQMPAGGPATSSRGTH